jgi:hypothetical protein
VIFLFALSVMLERANRVGNQRKIIEHLAENVYKGWTAIT